MAELLEVRLGSGTEGGGLVAALRRVIAATIEERMEYSLHDGTVRSTPPYLALQRLTHALQAAGHHVSFATFNYDIGLDVALHRDDIGVEYGLDGPSTSGTELHKLHGSLNWFQCNKCSRIVVHSVRDILRDGRRSVNFNARGTPRSLPRLRPSRRLKQSPGLTCCDQAVAPDPVIIPPTLSKIDAQKRLKTVWRATAGRLSLAHEIIVVGYSWPTGDQFFHYLYALGSMSERILRRVVVLDPAQTAAPRIAEMLGADVRRTLVPIVQPFDEESVTNLGKLLLGDDYMGSPSRVTW